MPFLNGPAREDLLRWYDDIREIHGSECGYVASGTDYPDPRDFKFGQFSYYLYLRDLEEVTRMMEVPDSEDGTVEKAQVPSAAPSGSWSEFSGRLDDLQTEYLRNALSEKVRINRKMEAAVNSIALETVGDTVVEDGKVPEEYREGLMKVL